MSTSSGGRERGWPRESSRRGIHTLHSVFLCDVPFERENELKLKTRSDVLETEKRIRKFYNVLFEFYGPQGWWPAETRLECAVGAILTQNASWTNAEKAVDALRRNSLLDAVRLRSVPQGRLAELIRPCGYHNLKARRLRNFVDFLFEFYGGKMENMLREDVDRLREKLLEVNGIGEETADSILLYALGKPSFVADAYTRRILARHGMISPRARYSEIRELFTRSLPRNATDIFGEYHALIVRTGKLHCKKTARCDGCPLFFDPHDPELRPD